MAANEDQGRKPKRHDNNAFSIVPIIYTSFVIILTLVELGFVPLLASSYNNGNITPSFYTYYGLEYSYGGIPLVGLLTIPAMFIFFPISIVGIFKDKSRTIASIGVLLTIVAIILGAAVAIYIGNVIPGSSA